MNESFSVGRAISLSLSIWFKNFIPFALLCVLISAPELLWLFSEMSSWTGELDMEKAMAIQSFAWKFLALGLATGVLLVSTYSYGVVSELRGQHAGMGATLAKGFSRFFPVLGSSLVMGVILALVGIAAVFVVAVPLATSPILAAIVMMTVIVGVYAIYYVTIPAAVVERPGMFGALGRSAALTSGRRGAVFGLLLLVLLAKFGLNKILESVLVDEEKIAQTMMDNPEGIWDYLKKGIWAQMVVDMIFSMFLAVLASVTYFLLRSEKEGTSADELAAVFD